MLDNAMLIHANIRLKNIFSLPLRQALRSPSLWNRTFFVANFEIDPVTRGIKIGSKSCLLKTYDNALRSCKKETAMHCHTLS